MRTHIVGIENRYYRSEEEAAASITPVIVRQLVARINGDRKTWTVHRMNAMPIPGIEAVPLRLRLRLAVLDAASLPAEMSKAITRTATLHEAFNLVRSDELSPEQVREFPVIRQFSRPGDSREYWRNMPQPE